MSFMLHPDLQRDSISVGSFKLCQVLLINDAHYPWFVLVPKRANIRDTIDLTASDYTQLWTESRIFSQGIMAAFKGEKLNVASLGNMTPQLHIHHIVRFKNDAAWPGPIWAKHPLEPYGNAAIDEIRAKLNDQSVSGFQT